MSVLRQNGGAESYLEGATSLGVINVAGLLKGLLHGMQVSSGLLPPCLRLPCFPVKTNFLCKSAFNIQINEQPPTSPLILGWVQRETRQRSVGHFSGRASDWLVLDQVTSSHPTKFPARNTSQRDTTSRKLGSRGWRAALLRTL